MDTDWTGQDSIPAVQDAAQERVVLRTCRHCNKQKPQTLEFFGINRGRFRYCCKQCHRDEQRAKYVKKKPLITVHPAFRECLDCGEHKANTTKNWLRTLKSRCRECHNKWRQERRAWREAGLVSKPLLDERLSKPSTKICNTCCGLPHRVCGIACPECGERYAEEPRSELELRRFDDIRSRCLW